MKNHPFVEDPEEELQQLEKEEQENLAKMEQYAGSFGSMNEPNNDGEE